MGHGRPVLVVTFVTVFLHLLLMLLGLQTLFNSDNSPQLLHKFHFTETVLQGNQPERF